MKQKQSLFSRAGIFELPIKNRKQVAKPKVKEFKTDVAPRKDFTKVQQLVSNYLDNKRHGKPFDLDFDKVNSSHGPILYNGYNHNRALNQQLKGNNRNVIEYVNKQVTDSAHSTKDKIFKYTNMTIQTENDAKLMYLLDKLEEEVKNIDLNTNEKATFDEKIRKIYGTLVGKLDLNIQNFKVLSTDSVNETTNDVYLNKFSEISPFQDNYGFNLNKPKNNNYRNIENNNYNSVVKYENKFDRAYRNSRKPKKISDNVEERKFRSLYDVRKNFKRNYEKLRSRIKDDDYFPLDTERRRYYHNKLASLQKKIKNMRRNFHPKKVSYRCHSPFLNI